MKIRMNLIALLLSFAPLAAVHAALPEGSFRGESEMTGVLGNADAFAFIIRNDPKTAARSYGVLMHYDRINYTNFTGTTAVVKWVPRMWVYQIEELSELRYRLTPLTVDRRGNAVPNWSIPSNVLVLEEAGSLEGATIKLDRFETIQFKGTVISTWEDYVPGKYFRSVDSSGMDYFKKDCVNTVVNPDRSIEFDLEEVAGKFSMVESIPGIFTFVSRDGAGGDKAEIRSKIGVFIDIMNWKKIAGIETPFQTNELMIADSENPSNVGFLYQRVFKSEDAQKESTCR